jgi:phage gpG-like protein
MVLVQGATFLTNKLVRTGTVLKVPGNLAVHLRHMSTNMSATVGCLQFADMHGSDFRRSKH